MPKTRKLQTKTTSCLVINCDGPKLRTFFTMHALQMDGKFLDLFRLYIYLQLPLQCIIYIYVFYVLSLHTRVEFQLCHFCPRNITDALSSCSRCQDGPRGEDNNMMSVSMTEDGSFVLAGRAEGVWSGDSSAGGLDFVAVKLDADGQEVWRWQVKET